MSAGVTHPLAGTGSRSLTRVVVAWLDDHCLTRSRPNAPGTAHPRRMFHLDAGYPANFSLPTHTERRISHVSVIPSVTTRDRDSRHRAVRDAAAVQVAVSAG